VFIWKYLWIVQILSKRIGLESEVWGDLKSEIFADRQ